MKVNVSISLVLALLMLAAFGPLTFSFARDWWRFSDEPLELTLDEAARRAAGGRLWVSVSDGRWQCARIQRVGQPHRIDLFAVTTEGAVVRAELLRPVSCREVPAMMIEGVIGPLTGPEREEVERSGITGSALYDLHECDQCGKAYQGFGALAFGLLLLSTMAFPALQRFIGRLQVQDAAALDAAAAQPDDDAAANRTVRRHGAWALALGGVLLAFADDPAKPLRRQLMMLVGVGLLAGGVMMVLAPMHYRRLRRSRWF